MVKWAGWLIVFYGTAHTLGALLAEGAANHAPAWFSGALWGQELSRMSPAMSAYWLSVNSFGPPLVVIGALVLWLNRRGIMPPSFVAWGVGLWAVADLALSGPGVGQGVIILAACGLLLVAARRDRHPAPQQRAHTEPRSH
jgi:hypothetical protein